MYAGLPWFFQFWTRDTLISLKALIIDKEYSTVKKILMEYLHQIGEDGLLSNRIPATITKSIDAIGWYFKRWDEFITALRTEKQLKNYFEKSEILFIINKLEDCINRVFLQYTKDNFAINKSQETWMDTTFEGGRNGIRIEIQALRLSMYNLLYKLTEKKVYEEMEEKLIIKIRENLWNGQYLKDGLDDDTIRPNIFIAAYLCPKILNNEEWTTCFEHILPKLWLEWGGIATIDKTDPRFHAWSSGESGESYHNGDSWFWINNITALVLYRTNYNKFKKYVDKIVESSCEDILFEGYIGCHAEISPASMRRGTGCLNQAWSNALFIELIKEMFYNV